MDENTNLVDLVIGKSEEKTFDWSKMPTSADVRQLRANTAAVYGQHPLSPFSASERSTLALGTRPDELPRLMAYRDMMHKSADGQTLGVPISVVENVIRTDTTLSGYELVEDTLADTVFTLLGLVGARIGRFNDACRAFVTRERTRTEQVVVERKFGQALRFVKQQQQKATDKIQRGKQKRRRAEEEVAAAAAAVEQVANKDALRALAKDRDPARLVRGTGRNKEA